MRTTCNVSGVASVDRDAGRRFWLVLVGLALAALGVRLLYTLAVGDTLRVGVNPRLGDIHFFHSTANLLADGHGYISPSRLESMGEHTPTAEHPPAWPFLLSLVSDLGGDRILDHRLVGCFLGAGVVILVGLLGRRAVGAGGGLLAAGVTAAHPLFVTGDGSLMSETLFVLFACAAMLAAWRVIDSPTTARALLLGATIGAAALTRGEGLLLLPLLALPLVLRLSARRVATLAVTCVGLALIIAPWAIRNWSVFDRPVLISTNDGTVLTGANCDATYRGRDLGFWREDCRSSVAERNEARLSARFRREGVNYAADNAERLPLVISVRLLRTFGFYQTHRHILLGEGRDPQVERFGFAVYFALLPFAAYGALLLLRRRHRDALVVLMAPLALAVVVSVFAYGYTRFRVAADVSIVVLACAGVLGAWAQRDQVRGYRLLRRSHPLEG